MAAAERTPGVRLWDEGPLARFAELERRYDGPIPWHLRDAALAADRLRLEQQRAAAQIQFFDEMARFQIAAIRGRERTGTDAAGLRGDLKLYLARRRVWRHLHDHYRRQAACKEAIDVAAILSAAGRAR